MERRKASAPEAGGSCKRIVRGARRARGAGRWRHLFVWCGYNPSLRPLPALRLPSFYLEARHPWLSFLLQNSGAKRAARTGLLALPPRDSGGGTAGPRSERTGVGGAGSTCVALQQRAARRAFHRFVSRGVLRPPPLAAARGGEARSFPSAWLRLRFAHAGRRAARHADRKGDRGGVADHGLGDDVGRGGLFRHSRKSASGKRCARRRHAGRDRLLAWTATSLRLLSAARRLPRATRTRLASPVPIWAKALGDVGDAGQGGRPVPRSRRRRRIDPPR